MRRRRPATPAALRRPIPERRPAPEHERVDVLAQDSVDDALLLKDRTFGFGLAGSVVVREAKQFEQGFGRLGEGRRDVRVRLVVPLEGGARPAVEDEERGDVQMQEAGEAVV